MAEIPGARGRRARDHQWQLPAQHHAPNTSHAPGQAACGAALSRALPAAAALRHERAAAAAADVRPHRHGPHAGGGGQRSAQWLAHGSSVPAGALRLQSQWHRRRQAPDLLPHDARPGALPFTLSQPFPPRTKSDTSSWLAQCNVCVCACVRVCARASVCV